MSESLVIYRSPIVKHDPEGFRFSPHQVSDPVIMFTKLPDFVRGFVSEYDQTVKTGSALLEHNGGIEASISHRIVDERVLNWFALNGATEQDG